MSCWAVLGIEATDNKKAIKKAYALLLKQNKPDENPEGFARLHAAYKQALQEAEYVAVQQWQAAEEEASTADLPDDIKAQPVSEAEAFEGGAPDKASAPAEAAVVDPVVINDPYVESEHQAFLASLETAWNALLEQTQTALESMEEADAVDVWGFLQDCEELYDLGFKDNYSHHLFTELLRFFNEQEVDPEQRLQTLQYLNAIFHWDEQYFQLEDYYGTNAVTPIFTVLSQPVGTSERKLRWTIPPYHEGPLELANYYARAAATMIDLVMMFIVVSWLTGVIDDSLAKSDHLLFTLAVYAFIAPLLEASAMQGTPGKVLFDLKVTNHNGRRLSLVHAIWRRMLHTPILPVHLVTGWLHIAMGNNHLLHDRVSRSLVVKR